MRELKFRAWDKWKNTMIQPNGGDFIGWHAMSNWRECLEVMQWTGLCDSNEVEIYEGDVVHVIRDKFGLGMHEYWRIEYACFGDPGYYAHNGLNSCRHIFVEHQKAWFTPLADPVECIVIGNIFENPGMA